jgi:DNA-binding MarR family transcriptional regulator
MMAARRDLLASLYPVTRALRRIEDTAAAAEGLTMWQYAILSVVGETPGSNQGTIARLLHYSANRIIADLDHLEERGLVIREPGADRRAKLVTVTRSGATVQRRVQRAIHAGEDELLAGLSASQRRQLHTLSGALAEQVRGD